jgi:putative ABC transport system ATP-binding protein
MTDPIPPNGARTTGLSVESLTVEYSSAGYLIRPLDGLSFAAGDGELVTVLGPSGCGKTTLLSCLAGLLTPASGSIRFGEHEVTGLSGKAMDRYRRLTVGVVFQAFNLIPSLTALRNVMLPLELAGASRTEAATRASSLLERVGLSDRMRHRPNRLSGGQQQRVAIARALAHNPPFVIADEPTAHLDHIQVEGILQLIRELAAPGRVVLIATHDDRVSRLADRVVHLVASAPPPPPEPVVVEIEPGHVLFKQGDPSDVVYVVEHGEMEIYRFGPDHEEERVALLGPGQYFGELGPLLSLPRSAYARARTTVRLTGYPPALFSQKMAPLSGKD